jgi:predicted AlkP superfamily phosphohydrolase/phosphomutase
MNRKTLTPILVRTVILAVVSAAALLPLTGCNSEAESENTDLKVIVLGFDGMDWVMTGQMIRDGQLPNFKKLADSGGFTPLGTSIPPQSPVAWSNFITGHDSGGHGIFDFIHRHPETMTPFLSTSVAAEGTMWKVGKYHFPSPFDGGSVELLRKGEAFWTVLEDHGIETTVIKMPANFPPSGTATREVSGMGTPDILGTYGTFSFYTTDEFAPPASTIDGGDLHLVEVRNGRLNTVLYGPNNPFVVEPTPLETELTVFVDNEADAARLIIGDNDLLLKPGEWSDWLPIEFEMIPSQTLPAIGRFYLRSVSPEFELYVTPLNIDPTNPAMPISTPPSYGKYLCQCTGYFYTQGMPEDTGAVVEGLLTMDEFLSQANLAGEENITQYESILGQFDGGFLFHYFGNTDLVGHIVWRSMDPEHPAYDAEKDAPYAHVMPDLYRRMDEVVGYTLDHMPENTLLVVMSDHGFAPWRRVMHLNAWLAENGYLTMKDTDKEGKNYSNVDWSKTRAYGLGLNGLYLNLKGREMGGIVDPIDRDALIAEIGEKLLMTLDPSTGENAVTKVYPREATYEDGGYLEIGPDIQVGYAERTRGSNASAIGEMSTEVFSDNTDRWSGDHCMDHESVPGILLTSRPMKKRGTTLKNLAASILLEFGIEDFPR